MRGATRWAIVGVLVAVLSAAGGWTDVHAQSDVRDTAGLYTVDVNTGEMRKVLAEGDYAFAMAADGKHLGYYAPWDPNRRVSPPSVMGIDGSNRQEINTGGRVGGFGSQTAWSPDNRHVVMILRPPGDQRTGRDLYIADMLNPSAAVQLVAPLGLALLPPREPSIARWSPRGDLIAYMGGQGGIYVVGPDGLHERQIATPSGYRISLQRWSVDGSRLVLEGDWTTIENGVPQSHTRYFTVDVATNAISDFPADKLWPSPDNTKAMHTEQIEPPETHNFTMFVEPSDRSVPPYPVGETNGYAFWMPDSQGLVAYRVNPWLFGLRTMNTPWDLYYDPADGSGERVLVPGREGWTFTQMSPIPGTSLVLFTGFPSSNGEG